MDWISSLKRTADVSLLQDILKSISESSFEYDLIFRANEILLLVDDDIVYMHKTLKNIYSKKFPELETVNLTPIEYVKTVQLIGHKTDLTKIDLNSILPPSLVLIVSMCSTTTSGRPLCEEELEKVFALCDETLKLDAAKIKILSFIESQMMRIAPNLSMIVGTAIAAKLVGLAGGIMNLARMPSGNLQVLGSFKKNFAGFSKTHANPHSGVIYECDLVRSIPEEFRGKAQRLIAGKATLAARADSDISKDPSKFNGSYGASLREAVEKKLEKWVEPPPIKVVKPLTAPKEYAKQRRGGKRVRKNKELLAVTQLRKLQNRLSFGVAEKETIVGDKIRGLGLAAGESGKIKVSADQQVREKMKRKAKESLSNFSLTSGIASTLAFNPHQGIELQNPDAPKKEETTSRYFSSSFKKPSMNGSSF